MERKPVKQGNAKGCGIACTAFVLGIRYREMLSLFNISKERARKNDDFYCKEIVSWLISQGLSYDYKYIKPKLRKRIYEDLTIVYIKRSKKYKFGHYLVRWNGSWMDPWINPPYYPRKAGFRKRLPGKPIYAIFKI